MIDSASEIVTYLTTKLTWPLPLVVWPVPFAIPFWMVYIWSRQGERKVLFRGQTTENHDRSSWVFIDYGSKIAKVVALIAAFLTPPWIDGEGRIFLYGFGLALMVSGASLRRHCFKTLGKHFTFQVTVPDTHEIIKDGIYRWVRHPSYTGGMLFNAGIGVALTNCLSTLFLTAGMAAVYIYRVHVEEKALVTMHGDSYKSYMRETRRFLPFIF